MQKGNRKHIGIIGGGISGLISAWLLENDYAVTLFEKEDHIGGHLCSVSIPIGNEHAIVEAGAEFFSGTMFPELNRLLNVLQVPVHQYPLTYTFYNIVTKEYIQLPPINGHISWHSLTPHHIYDLVQFKEFVDGGKEILNTHNTSITMLDYTQKLGLADEFTQDFLFPLFATTWGASLDDVKNFAAYDILKWATHHRPSGLHAAQWHEVIGGASAYLNALAKQLAQTTIKYSSLITNLSHENKKYCITLNTNEKYEFDHLIIATNALIARDLLKNIPITHDARAILSSIEYFDATVAVHGDRRFMPPDESIWSVVNVLYDGNEGSSTVYKPWRTLQQPLFRTWITYPVGLPAGVTLPEPLYAIKHYQHGKVNPAYFQAQRDLAPLQGINNLWLAGIYTHDEDSHNSAIISAIKIAQELAPSTSRLHSLIS